MVDHDVEHQAGERQEPADVGVGDALLLCKVGVDFARLLSIRRRQRGARTSVLTSVSSRGGLLGAGGTADGGPLPRVVIAAMMPI
jgi:hypothetical protein